MRINELKYKKYTFPFKQPFSLSQQTIYHKEVIIIRAEDDSGNYHYGEVSPLIGFSSETIEVCERKLTELISGFTSIDIHEYKLLVADYKDFPSLLFGLEQVIISIDMLSSNEESEFSINCNGIIGLHSNEQVFSQVTKLYSEGFKTIKLKIGREAFEEDFKIIDRINNEFGNNIELRLDNNGCWDLNEAIENIELLKKYNIQYIEQPVLNDDDLLKIAQNSEIAIAVDESIINYNKAEEFIKNHDIKYLIIKPSLRLGIFDTKKVIELAKLENCTIIISSAFETPIGRNALLYLTSFLDSQVAQGLNTEVIGRNIIKSKMLYNSHIIKFTAAELFSHSIPNFND